VNSDNSIEEEIQYRITLGNKAYYAKQFFFKSRFVSKKLKLTNCLLGIPRRLSIKSRRFGTLCRFHLQQVVKCVGELEGLSPYLYGKGGLVGRWSGPIRSGGGVGVVGVKWVCRHGGGVYKSLGAAGDVKFLLLSFEVVV
jgi:hypothetical protein